MRDLVHFATVPLKERTPERYALRSFNLRARSRTIAKCTIIARQGRLRGPFARGSKNALARIPSPRRVQRHRIEPLHHLDLYRHRIRLMEPSNHYDESAARHGHQPVAREKRVTRLPIAVPNYRVSITPG